MYLCDSGGNVIGRVRTWPGMVEIEIKGVKDKYTVEREAPEAEVKLDAIKVVMGEVWDESYDPKQRFADIQRILSTP